MLRLFMVFSLGLAASLGAVSVLIARQWGWSEYTSPQLYVVYYQVAPDQNQFFVVNTDGSSVGQRLTWKSGAITQFDCSPDGRTLAFLTSQSQLYVMTSAGLLRDSPVDPAYTTVNVANDGTTALFDPAEDRLLVADQQTDLQASDKTANAFDRVDISAQGKVLWMRNFDDIQVVSLADGSITPYVPHGYSGTWLASGQIFAYADNMTDPEGVGLYGGQYLMDMATHMVATIGDWDLSRPLSPDATQVAAPIAINGRAQIVVYDLLTNAHRRVLTHDTHTASQPVCFLTFQPQALISP